MFKQFSVLKLVESQNQCLTHATDVQLLDAETVLQFVVIIIVQMPDPAIAHLALASDFGCDRYIEYTLF